jgi:hypothetical protein
VVTTDLLSRSSPRVDLRGGRRTESLSEIIGLGHQKVAFVWFPTAHVVQGTRKIDVQLKQKRNTSS